MAYLDNPSGLSLPTTQSLNLGQLNELKADSTQFKQLIVRLYQQLNQFALVINKKESGVYVSDTEVVTSKTFEYAPDETYPIYMKLIDIGALGAGVTTVAHNITPATNLFFTQIYGAASLYNANPLLSQYVSLPWVSAGGAANIEVIVNGTNIVITNNSGIAFTSSQIVLEYGKA
jgi:hypothetical protein